MISLSRNLKVHLLHLLFFIIIIIVIHQQGKACKRRLNFDFKTASG